MVIIFHSASCGSRNLRNGEISDKYLEKLRFSGVVSSVRIPRLGTVEIVQRIVIMCCKFPVILPGERIQHPEPFSPGRVGKYQIVLIYCMNQRNLFDNRDSRRREKYHFFLLGNDFGTRLRAGQFCKICFPELPRQICW